MRKLAIQTESRGQKFWWKSGHQNAWQGGMCFGDLLYQGDAVRTATEIDIRQDGAKPFAGESIQSLSRRRRHGDLVAGEA